MPEKPEQMSDPVIEALRAAVASETRTKPRKGDLQRWMRKRQADIAELLADGISWEQFAEEMNRQGITNDHGGPVRAITAERNWRRVQLAQGAVVASGRPQGT